MRRSSGPLTCMALLCHPTGCGVGKQAIDQKTSDRGSCFHYSPGRTAQLVRADAGKARRPRSFSGALTIRIVRRAGRRARGGRPPTGPQAAACARLTIAHSRAQRAPGAGRGRAAWRTGQGPRTGWRRARCEDKAAGPRRAKRPRDASGRRSAVRIGSSAEQAVRPLEDRRRAGGRYSSSPERVPEQTGRGCAGWAASCAQHSEAPDGSRLRTRREAQAEAGGRRAAHRPSADRQKKRRNQPSASKRPHSSLAASLTDQRLRTCTPVQGSNSPEVAYRTSSPIV